MTTHHLPTGGTTPNIPELRKAVEWVEAEEQLDWKDREWDQRSWWRENRIPRPTIDGDCITNSTKLSELSVCGTSFCVAGFVASNHGWKTNGGHEFYKDGESKSVITVAGEILGLNTWQASELFHQAHTAKTIRQQAENIAGERL